MVNKTSAFRASPCFYKPKWQRAMITKLRKRLGDAAARTPVMRARLQREIAFRSNEPLDNFEEFGGVRTRAGTTAAEGSEDADSVSQP